MSTQVTLPPLGESVAEGTVSRWLKQIGDKIAADEPLLEVSTDKVDTEVPSPVSGVLLQILVQEDETAAVGAVLAVVGDEAGLGAAAAEPTPPEVDAEPAFPAPAGESAATWAEAAAASPAAPPDDASQPVQPPPPAAPRAWAAADEPYATPLVRKLAAEHGVSLAGLTGSGVGGRIRKQDIFAAAAAAAKPVPVPEPVLDPAATFRTPAPVPAAPATPTPAAPVPDAPAPAAATPPADPAAAAPDVPADLAAAAPAPSDLLTAALASPPAVPAGGTTEKLSRLRASTARRMVESLQGSAQLTATVEADLTAVSRLRAQAKAQFEARE
ncbi:MAG: E3 binding domain-containing protein, partial [Propionibacteriaceae bacterium]|nr:E3 binding domain-containing protein [Propionibacteriaceae bacterium]